MFQRMAAEDSRRCLAAADAHPLAVAPVAYPRWYMQRWHFLPEGYLSRRSALGYDRVVRPLYYAGRERRVHRALIEPLADARPARVVELGCGPGRLVRALARAFPETCVTGIDLSPFMCEIARRETAGLANAEVLHRPARETGIESGSVGAVIACHLLGHVPPGAASAVLKEVARLLVPGGRCYLVEHAWHAAPRSLLGEAGATGLPGGMRLTVLQQPAG